PPFGAVDQDGNPRAIIGTAIDSCPRKDIGAYEFQPSPAVTPNCEGISAPASLAFGSHDVGTSTTQTVTITNNGEGPLSLEGLSIPGADAGRYTLKGGCPAMLAGLGGSCALGVAFTPDSAGAKTAVLHVPDFNGFVPEKTVALTGTGTNPAPPPAP